MMQSAIKTLRTRRAPKSTVLVALAITLALPLSVKAQGTTPTSGFNPSLVVAAFGETDPQQRIVVAHRGLWKQQAEGQSQCPENSHCSIAAAAQYGVEAIEIDVKPSIDKTLWAFHDQTIGRVTNYEAAGCYQNYNPAWTTANNPDPIPKPGLQPKLCTNPLISTLHDSQIEPLLLRNNDGTFPSSPVHPYTLSALMTLVSTQLVVMLDLKSLADVQQAIALANNHNMLYRTIFKFPSSLINPVAGGLPTYLNGVHWTVTVGAGDLQRILTQAGDPAPNDDQAGAQELVDGWLQALLHPISSPGIQVPSPLYVELRMKSNLDSANDPLRGTWDVLTTSPSAVNPIAGIATSVSIFSPTPDVVVSRSTSSIAAGEYYYLDWADGGGYYTLDSRLTTNIAPFPSETEDLRQDQNFVLEYDNSVITDEPLSMIQYATVNGRPDGPSGQHYRDHIRNLCYNDNCNIPQYTLLPN